MERYIGILGIAVCLGIAYAISENRKKINFKLVGAGLSIQMAFAFIILWTTPGKVFFEGARLTITRLISFSDNGASMVFGDGFREHFFAFSVLPTIIFVSATMAVFFYLGIMQKIVGVMAKFIIKVMRVSGAEALSASANVFIGQTEAPLLIKPYIQTMTRSEILAMMTGGMATMAGGVLAAYVSFGADAGHLLAASMMACPASLVLAKIICPETKEPKTMGNVKVDIPKIDSNVLDAACRGASEGVSLALNVAGMLIAFVSIMALMNYCVTLLPDVGGAPMSIERILSWLFAPIAFLIGVEWKDSLNIGMLLGKKILLNEFVAYLNLKDLKDVLSPRSFNIATYALCGFANFSSIAIQIGGIGNLIPEKRKEIASLGLKAMVGGVLSALLNAAIAGMLL